MAKATKEVKQVQVTRIEEQETITLELSKEEAELLRFITESIAGSTTKSQRRYADAIAYALREANIEYRSDFSDLVKDGYCTIWFSEGV